MGWELTIDTIDVGQGESSLIVVKYDGAIVRTMLIDGGKNNQAPVVNAYLDHWKISSVDVVVVSHYDDDHSGGIIELLKADNLYVLCEQVAINVVNIVKKYGGLEQVAAATGATYAILIGAYKDCLQEAEKVAKEAVERVTKENKMDCGGAVGIGLDTAICFKYGDLNDILLFPNSPKIKNISRCIGRKINQVGALELQLLNELYTNLWSYVRVKNRCCTVGKFRNSIIVDTGKTNGIPDAYRNYLDGDLMIASTWRRIPWVRRRERIPNLGDEILRDPEDMGGDNMPEMYVMAINKYIWPGKGPIALAEDNNNDSIGLLLQFGSFYYYTGGDLPIEGENIIATSIMNDKLQHRLFPVPTQGIAAFKCGHHGSHYSTSQCFLNTLKPKVALISCGDNSFGHPHQDVIDHLHEHLGIKYFFLTGCVYHRDHVPASPREKKEDPFQIQLKCVGNKSRVSGSDECKGNIRLYVYESDLTNNAGRFGVEYYDWDNEGYVSEWIEF